MIAFPNLQRKDPFTYSKTLSFAGTELTLDYIDIGWVNSGIDISDHDNHEVETIDNSAYYGRGTDVVYICHRCRKFWHVDMSD